jgi:hypothetical protein
LDQVLKSLSVVLLAALELWAAIPAGFALGLSPAVIGICSAAGAILATFLVIWIGNRLRSWIVKRHTNKKDPGKPGRIQRIWKRYGVIGLGLLAPLLTGAPLGAALGISLGAQKGWLMLWMSTGILLWTALLTTLGALGIQGINRLF